MCVFTHACVCVYLYAHMCVHRHWCLCMQSLEDSIGSFLLSPSSLFPSDSHSLNLDPGWLLQVLVILLSPAPNSIEVRDDHAQFFLYTYKKMGSRDLISGPCA